MLSFHLHLHLLRDVWNHHVDQAAGEEDHMLRKNDGQTLHHNSRHTNELQVSRSFTPSTDLKDDDETESYGEEVEVLWQEVTSFIPETPIPAENQSTGQVRDQIQDFFLLIRNRKRLPAGGVVLLDVAVWRCGQGEVHVAAQTAVLGVAVVQARHEGRGEGDEKSLQT